MKHNLKIKLIALIFGSILASSSYAKEMSCKVCEEVGGKKEAPIQKIENNRDEIVDCIDYKLFGSDTSPDERAKEVGLELKKDETWSYATINISAKSLSVEKKIPAMFKRVFGAELAAGVSDREGDGLHEWLMCKALFKDMGDAKIIACKEGGEGEDEKCE